ncbi:hypothetical protein B0T24DRAFT_21788 [Lasiosphaeria ovina]|uniref:UBC core domain-containing protein n=1 Tax=Lasiosphaeria ovina TaxID=92902 RepID=A0AAE0TX63_9PEZI|nr:hypothetical protein B0T24DRAFT_21788 [Lasiosphaeria ovina]
MDPLSITASVAGILSAAAQVAKILGQVKDAPESIKSIVVEVNHIKIVVTALQRFIDRTIRLDPERAALIQIEDVVTILTQTVLVFSELETVVKGASSSSQDAISRLRDRVTWTWQQGAALRLVGQLQQHKTSLSLLLQIIQCESNVEAFDSAASLQDHIGQQLERDSDLASRLQQLDLPPGAIELDDLTPLGPGSPDGDTVESAEVEVQVGALGNSHPPGPPPIPPSSNVTADAASMPQANFDDILSESWVYNRNRDRETDAASTILTTRSRAWSILSGLSLAQISVIAVIKLPLNEMELKRFFLLAFSSAMDSSLTIAEASESQTQDHKRLRNTMSNVERRLNKELADLERNLNLNWAAGPIGDNMLDWQATIMAPNESLYSGGFFFLRIDFPVAYPLTQPRVNFMTRIYHPNINSKGEIRGIEMLTKQWYPMFTVSNGTKAQKPLPLEAGFLP